MGARSGPHEYIIGNGDLLDISVFDVPELTRELRVSQLGTIGIPLVPVRLRVAGLTEVQAEQKIAEVLEANGLVSHPEVGVTVKEHKSRPITIVGAVLHPMVYEADRSVTLLEALAEAGGVSGDASDTVIISRAHSATFIEVSDSATSANNPAPGSGEPPEIGASAGATPDSGAAKSAAPGSSVFPSASQMAQNKAASPATGNLAPAQVAAPSSLITINLNELLETGDLRNNIVLQGGDVVTVPHAGIVYVLGAVNRPGGFVISNDRTQFTTLKVLSLAGGLTKIAKQDHAVIIRKDDQGKQTETEVDLKKVLNRESEDLQLRASDILYVPESRGKDIMYQTLQIAVAVATATAIYRVAYR
ncbi:MAG TPA: polysaccharide biosynthesis/export family protein [Candidatus Acidoferrum sp.]|nr:polysaccharide biosynthesis/export family protein [Candidatus Acidoferrum sp.]